MPWVWFEATIPEFEHTKVIHALDRAATVNGHNFNYFIQDVFGLLINAVFCGDF
jgi:hypothetical protein